MNLLNYFDFFGSFRCFIFKLVSTLMFNALQLLEILSNFRGKANIFFWLFLNFLLGYWVLLLSLDLIPLYICILVISTASYKLPSIFLAKYFATFSSYLLESLSNRFYGYYEYNFCISFLRVIVIFINCSLSWFGCKSVFF